MRRMTLYEYMQSEIQRLKPPEDDYESLRAWAHRLENFVCVMGDMLASHGPEIYPVNLYGIKWSAIVGDQTIKVVNPQWDVVGSMANTLIEAIEKIQQEEGL